MRSPWIIAHRGASGHAPENTMAAFERAAELRARFVETDVHLTRDGSFVAIHDGTLERTTNGRGAVHDFTLAELRELDAGSWFDPQFRGQRIPTLEEILEFMQRSDTDFYFEIKYDAAWGMHHALVAALRHANHGMRSTVLSFDPSTLLALRRLDASVMMGLLTRHAKPDAVEAAIEVGARQVCPRWDLVTRSMVERAHRSDLRLVTWTINDEQKMRDAIDAGVDGIMTDFPDRLRTVIERG